jgi:4-amino-4-deoxy-L-arabinose transferase-like glycosyltransferase
MACDASGEHRPEPAVKAGRVRRALGSVRGTPLDLAIVLAITALAAGLRVWHLGSVPLGLHGDEAWTGLDARRALKEGWIGPYVPSALGQPTGPLYVTAVLFRFLPQTTTTLRFSIALFGIATIPLAYLAFSTMFDRTVGAFSSFLLAVMMWHLHLSRTAFMVTAWPFTEMATVWLLWLALRRRSLVLFVAAGVAHGLGIYTYNADTLFLPVPFVALAWAFFAAPGRAERRRLLAGSGVFAVAALIVAAPMLVYVIRHTDTYRFHERVVSVTHSDAWRDASVPWKANIIRHRFDEWVSGIATGGRPDLGDGLATSGHPLVDGMTLVLAAIGLVMILREWRRAESSAVLAVLVLMPWGALLTVEDGLFRRTLGLTPFIALAAALPLAWLWRGLCELADSRRPLFLAAVVAALAFDAGWTAYQYFGPVQGTETMRFVYPRQMDAASHFIGGLPPGTYVYFYSERWSFDYETRRFIAPDAKGIDRSYEFGAPSVANGAVDYSIEVPGPVAFVFLGSYLDDIGAVAERYPGGATVEGDRDGEVDFRAYVLPQR